jgi:hypothetical protein
MDTGIKLCRVLLLIFGCLPMIVLHTSLTLGVLLFALPAVFMGGHPGNIVFVIWWLLGTYALVSLVCSCATYRRASSPQRLWQQLGLVIGILAAAPLVLLGFTHGAEKIAAALGVVAAIIVLFTDRRHEDLVERDGPGAPRKKQGE